MKEKKRGRFLLRPSLLGLVFLACPLWADAPGVINYQGKLADANGNPRSGTLPMIFRIYDAASGGNLLVSDDRTTSLVPITNGVFDVLIGSGTIVAGTKTSVAAAIQSTPNTYLQVSISGTNLSPRQRLVATPYALTVAANSVGSAEIIDGSIGNADLAPSSVGSSEIIDGSVGSADLAPSSVGSSEIVDGSIVNADVAAGAGITVTKLSAGVFPVGNYSFAGSTLTISSMTVTDRIDMNGRPIQNLPTTPASANDAASKSYVDSQISGGASQWTTNGLEIGYTAGNVGIGTTNPTANFELNLGANQFGAMEVHEGATKATALGDATGSGVNGILQLFSNGTETHRLFADPTQKSWITSGAPGNLGIGTTNPGYKLDVIGDVRASGGWLRNNGAQGWYNDTYASGLYMTDVSWIRSYGTAGLWFNNATIGTNGSVSVGYSGTAGPTGGAIFAGDVGIGTTNPTQILQVKDIDPQIILENSNSGALASLYNNSNLVGATPNLDIGFPVSEGSNRAINFRMNGVNIMTILGTGNVGVGTISPSNRLVVGDDSTGATTLPNNSLAVGSASTDAIITVGSAPSAKGYIKWKQALNYFEIGTANGSPTEVVSPFEATSGASKPGGGTWADSSDRRIKKDIKDITNALGVIGRLHPVEYRYIDEYRAAYKGYEDRPYYNFIAQEFQQVFPNSVKDSGKSVGDIKNILEVDTSNLIPYLVKAVQEQQSQISELKAQNEVLQQRINVLEEKK